MLHSDYYKKLKELEIEYSIDKEYLEYNFQIISPRLGPYIIDIFYNFSRYKISSATTYIATLKLSRKSHNKIIEMLTAKDTVTKDMGIELLKNDKKIQRLMDSLIEGYTNKKIELTLRELYENKNI